MTKAHPELEEVEALLKRVKSLLREKETFRGTNDYEEAQGIVEYVTEVVDQETNQMYYQRYPQRAVNKLTRAKKILEKLK